jgi:hypothetical protein
VSIRRLKHAPADLQVISEAERGSLGLPVPPPWVADYGEQPPAGSFWGSWRADARLAGRFHPDYPDDLRVLVGEDTPAGFQVEAVWVSLRSCSAEGCAGVLLNQPEVVRLRLGQTVAFRFAHLPPSGLPPVAALGEEPAEALVDIALRQPAEAQQQDDPLWVPADHLPEQDRLLPMSQWVRVGDQLAFIHLGPHGPIATVFTEQGRFERAVDWLTQGMRVLTREERRRLRLPASPLEDPRGQPKPGPWGEWRLDPRLQRALSANDPDLVQGMLASPTGAPGEAKVLQARLRACLGMVCEARATEAAPQAGVAVGDRVLVLLVDGEDGLPTLFPVPPRKGGRKDPSP